MGRYVVASGAAGRTSPRRPAGRAPWWLVGLSVLACAVERDAGRAEGAGERPNVLFLLSDDHSAPYLGCYGYPGVRTPHLDRFAAHRGCGSTACSSPAPSACRRGPR